MVEESRWTQKTRARNRELGEKLMDRKHARGVSVRKTKQRNGRGMGLSIWFFFPPLP